jgi:hypothetical protein
MGESKFQPADKQFIYDIEVKNYNDLVLRNKEFEVIPLVLILVVVPDNIEKWILESDKTISFNARKYWYLPSRQDRPSENKTKVRIKIPLENTVTLDLFPAMFERFHGQKF